LPTLEKKPKGVRQELRNLQVMQMEEHDNPRMDDKNSATDLMIAASLTVPNSRYTSNRERFFF
jgi:hypothetical protein